MGNEFTDTFEAEVIGNNPTLWTEVTENAPNNVEVVSTVGLDMQSSKCCMLDIAQVAGAASIRKVIANSTDDFRIRARIRFDDSKKIEGGNALIGVWGGNAGDPDQNYAFIQFRFMINAALDALDLYIYNDALNQWDLQIAGILAFDTSYEIELKGTIAGQYTDLYINQAYVGSYAVEEVDMGAIINHNMLSFNAYGIAGGALSCKFYCDNVRWDSQTFTSPFTGAPHAIWEYYYYDDWLKDWLKQFEDPIIGEEIIKPKVDLMGILKTLGVLGFLGVGIYGLAKYLEKNKR